MRLPLHWLDELDAYADHPSLLCTLLAPTATRKDMLGLKPCMVNCKPLHNHHWLCGATGATHQRASKDSPRGQPGPAGSGQSRWHGRGPGCPQLQPGRVAWGWPPPAPSAGQWLPRTPPHPPCPSPHHSSQRDVPPTAEARPQPQGMVAQNPAATGHVKPQNARNTVIQALLRLSFSGWNTCMLWLTGS